MTNHNSPIGVFDSGIGGLTVLKEIRTLMPNENVVYFGDTARVPYGSKSKDTVMRYVRQIIRFLKTKEVKAIVIACNTASAYALFESALDEDIPVIGVIDAGVKTACNVTKNKRIGIIGTDGAIQSGVHAKMINRIDSQISVFGKACPLFVPFAEEGLFDTKLTDGVVEHYLSYFKPLDIDTLILGCTHYPLLINAIRRYLGDNINYVNPAYETACQLRELLLDSNMLCDADNTSVCEFFVSDCAKKMISFADMILGGENNKITALNIENY
ncbi:MAG: glutamate racemase [Oscillospiraceae bacterium]|nr:glutamate racemase [Oscillospiraceae bacterium]